MRHMRLDRGIFYHYTVIYRKPDSRVSRQNDTITAKWIYAITYDANGGTGVPASQAGEDRKTDCYGVLVGRRISVLQDRLA